MDAEPVQIHENHRRRIRKEEDSMNHDENGLMIPPHSLEAEQSVKPCKKCGSVVRYKNKDCKHCADKRNAAWRSSNLEKKAALDSEYNKANKDRCNAKGAAWYEKNKEKCLLRGAELRKSNTERYKLISAKWRANNHQKSKNAQTRFRIINPNYKSPCAVSNPNYWKEYRLSNLENYRIYSQNRRKKTGSGKLSKGLAAKLFILQRGKCACCKKPLGNDYHLDHIIPIALGGENEDWNIQLLRARCNNLKRAKHPIDFMQERGFLL
jgi:hypothetical protein